MVGTPAPTNPLPSRRPVRSSPSRSRRRAGAAALLVVVLAAGIGFVVGAPTASADAVFGPGLRDVTTDGFTHPWLGGYETDVGTAWCIETAKAYPRAHGNVPTGDLPAARGVSEQHRNALAYAVWAYGDTDSDLTAAGLATVVHGLSGDDHASVEVPAMQVSDPGAKFVAEVIYHEAMDRAFWVSDPGVDPWRLTTKLSHRGGATWEAVTTLTTHDDTPVVGHEVSLMATNVVEEPGTRQRFVTDSTGRFRTEWTQADPDQPIVVDTAVRGPRTYNVWQGPDYPLGSVPQQVITPDGTTYRARGQADLPTGQVRLRKRTDNPAYQSAAGATFEVTRADDGGPVGTLVVGPDGDSEALVLPVGDYLVTETGAPDGVLVDPEPHPVTITAGRTRTLELVDPVRREAELTLVKLDAVTGEPVAGAEFLVERDADGDGTFDETVGTFVSELTPVSVPGLSAGVYRVTEIAAPEGYEMPPIAVQDVTMQWNGVATVTFHDHRTPTLTTRSMMVDDAGEPVSPPRAPDGLGNAANVVVPVGGSLRDTVTVAGLAAGQAATVTTRLYGPFTPGDTLICDDAHQVWSDSWEVDGPGDSVSGVFTPTEGGLYGYVATVQVPEVGSFSGVCGDPEESALVVPEITTEAQAPRTGPGAPVTDAATVAGLATGVTARIHTSLYGPFTDPGAIEQACAADDLGTPVGTVTGQVVGTGEPLTVTSPEVVLPSRDHDGYYTFIAVLEIPGFPLLTHPCGSPEETFEVDPPPPPTTTTTTTVPETTTTVPESTTTTVPPTTVPETTTTSTTTVPETTTTTTSTTSTVPPATTTIPPPTTTTTVPETTTTTTTVPETTSTTAPPAKTPVVPPTTAPPAPPASVPPPTDGELPRTGTTAGRLAGVGSILALLGAVGVLAAERRRRPERA